MNGKSSMTKQHKITLINAKRKVNSSLVPPVLLLPKTTVYTNIVFLFQILLL